MNDPTNNAINNPSVHHSPNGRISTAAALDAALDKRIDAAIERKPAPAIPPAFAARITTQLAARAATTPRRRAHTLPIGRTIGWASAALLTAALFVVAPHATPNIASLRFDTEIILLIELAGIGWLLSRGIGLRRSQ